MRPAAPHRYARCYTWEGVTVGFCWCGWSTRPLDSRDAVVALVRRHVVVKGRYRPRTR